MDMDSGDKECPRCGLKNRLGTYQCDFCGWDFSSGSDEWLDKVSALEHLGRSASVHEMDQGTIGRIELSIKKPEEIHVRPTAKPMKEVAQESVDAPAIEPEIGDEIEIGTEETDPSEVMDHAENEVVPAEEVTSPPEEMVPTEVEVASESIEEAPAINEDLPEIVPEMPIVAPSNDDIKVPTPAAPSEEAERRSESGTQELDMVSIALLAAGAVIYIAAILISPAMGKVAGWALAIIGALLITLAAGRWLGRRRKIEKDDEVVICSKCHEVVSDAESECPSCGAMFTRPMLKE